MKRKLLILALILIPLFGNGQGIKHKNELDTMVVNMTIKDIIEEISKVEPYKLLIIGNDTIVVTKNIAIVNTSFCIDDLQKDQAKDCIIQLQNMIIDEQGEQLSKKDTTINQQSKQILDLQERYVAMSSMVVMCEKECKNEKKLRKVFQYAFMGMCGVAFFLGVN